MQEFIIPNVGPVSIEGELVILKYIPNVSRVFLFDEYHASCECIEQNSSNALSIASIIEVQLVGVEGFNGGTTWDPETNSYTADPPLSGDLEHARHISSERTFADRMKGHGLRVVGVDCEGLCDQIETDRIDRPHLSANGRRHPNNEKRSRHFIQTLFHEKRRLKLKGDIFLNAGRNHIDDINGSIYIGEIEDLVGCKASYYRVRSTAYPDD